MRRWFTLSLLLVMATAVVSAGDLATFQNLGFSADGRSFAFAQYGVAGEEATAFAEIYVVDVAGNVFVSNGTFDLESDIPLDLGQDGRGALYALLADAQATLGSRRIEHLRTGRPIYIQVDGEASSESLTFRDFSTQTRYEISLDQSSRVNGDRTQAAFSIEARLIRGDAVETLQIGRPSLFRDDVESYRITQILSAPGDNGIVIVVERRSPDGSIRYMVETASVD